MITTPSSRQAPIHERVNRLVSAKRPLHAYFAMLFEGEDSSYSRSNAIIVDDNARVSRQSRTVSFRYSARTMSRWDSAGGLPRNSSDDPSNGDVDTSLFVRPRMDTRQENHGVVMYKHGRRSNRQSANATLTKTCFTPKSRDTTDESLAQEELSRDKN